MTLAASLFRHLAASWCDVDVVFEPPSCEVIGMPETISRFGRVFANEPGRRVAVVANGRASMAGF